MSFQSSPSPRLWRTPIGIRLCELLSSDVPNTLTTSQSPNTPTRNDIDQPCAAMSHQQEGSAGIDESDLAPTQTAGYRVGQQKTIDELQNLDKDDEALNRWKQSLLGSAGASSAASGAKPTVRLQRNNPIEAPGLDMTCRNTRLRTSTL